MAVEVFIPSLGEVVEEVVILNWLKSEGDRVQKDDPLIEVESEKVNTEIPSPATGILGKILYPAGSKVGITKVVAVIVAEGEAVPEKYRTAATPPAGAKPQTTVAPAAPSETKRAEKIRVAPVARKMAEVEGVDLSLVTPTGPHGTIMRKDVEDYLARRREQEKTKKTVLEAPSAPASPGQTVSVEIMRLTIARRMAKSASTIPHINLFSELWMDPLLELRDKLKAGHQGSDPFAISVNDFILKGIALALREYPYLNAQWQEDKIQLMGEVNIGLAVALKTGLTVPALLGVDRLSIPEISRQRIDLVERAREGRLQKAELERGTFTFTSLANSSVTLFTAIINPPQSAILSIGMTQDKLVLKEGKVEVRRISGLGLSIDHRVADGAYGAAFLDSLKRKLENPDPNFLSYLTSIRDGVHLQSGAVLGGG